MAHIDNNIFIEGLRGNVAKQIVYRKQGNRTVASRMPKLDPNREPTEGQIEQRDKFAEASDYAQEILGDAELKAIYQQDMESGKTLRGTIVRDYFIAPTVYKIDATAYKGAVGDLITIKAKDDFRVVAVHVLILNAMGEVVEEGAALLDPRGRRKWLYTATAANSGLAGCTIAVTATDMPGNVGSLEITL